MSGALRATCIVLCKKKFRKTKTAPADVAGAVFCIQFSKKACHGALHPPGTVSRVFFT